MTESNDPPKPKGRGGKMKDAGKGGLGKTTCSAGLSHYMASKRKRNVLCFSTDPQASLSDIFDRDIFGKGLVSVIPNLDVVEIDADRRVADYQDEVKQKILTMYGLTELPAEIEEYIDSTSAEPAMYESATYDAMADLVSTSGHDLYVFDMPPFGHGVCMIAMAEILSKWVGKITEAREKAQEYEAVAATLKGTKVSEDEVLKELQDIQEKITRFTDLMVDQRRTSFFMVLIPERMAILDTERALEMFDALGLQMAGLIVNQVYPAELAEAKGGEAVEFLRNRARMQRKYLDEIKSKFAGKVVAMLPMYPREGREERVCGRGGNDRGRGTLPQFDSRPRQGIPEVGGHPPRCEAVHRDCRDEPCVRGERDVRSDGRLHPQRRRSVRSRDLRHRGRRERGAPDRPEQDLRPLAHPHDRFAQGGAEHARPALVPEGEGHGGGEEGSAHGGPHLHERAVREGQRRPRGS